MMELREHAGLAAVEKALEHVYRAQQKHAYQRSYKPTAGSASDKAHKARGRLRAAVRKAADAKFDFKSTRNGDASFDFWKEGLEFALKNPGVGAVDYHMPTGNTLALFYKPAGLEKLSGIVKKFLDEAGELLKLVDVEEVMTA